MERGVEFVFTEETTQRRGAEGEENRRGRLAINHVTFTGVVFFSQDLPPPCNTLLHRNKPVRTLPAPCVYILFGQPQGTKDRALGRAPESWQEGEAAIRGVGGGGSRGGQREDKVSGGARAGRAGQGGRGLSPDRSFARGRAGRRWAPGQPGREGEGLWGAERPGVEGLHGDGAEGGDRPLLR